MSELGPVVVRIRDVAVRYGETVAVDGVDLDVEGPGITALLGPSGCGKTSLLRVVAGFEAPSAGSVRIGDTEVVGPGRWVAPERRRVGMVFQEGALFPHLTVEANVRYGLGNGVGTDARVDEVLRLVGLQGLGGRYPDELSGGQQQRVALARALAPAPGVVLLDEPFANLDASLRVRVRDEVRTILLAAGATAVLVTHDQEEALSVADRVAVMSEGRILQTGTPEGIYHRPATPEVFRFVGDGQLLPCRVERSRAFCAFGAVPCEGDEGAGLLAVRPEDLELVGEGEDPRATGHIARRRFFGHDLIDEVVLDRGATIQVRSLASLCPPVGTRVALRLRPKLYRVFADG